MEKSVKKCPACGQWSKWNQNFEDRCEHCGKLLAPVELKDQEEIQEMAEKNEKFSISLVQIHPDDNFLVAGIKRVIQAFQLVFMGIVSFLVWLATAVAG